jgi:hypothetical protein
MFDNEKLRLPKKIIKKAFGWIKNSLFPVKFDILNINDNINISHPVKENDVPAIVKTIVTDNVFISI